MKRTTYLGLNLTKEEKYLCTENYKILIKEINEDRWKKAPIHRFEELILLCPYHPKRFIGSGTVFQRNLKKL
jgi:hypothetical protein